MGDGGKHTASIFWLHVRQLVDLAVDLMHSSVERRAANKLARRSARNSVGNVGRPYFGDCPCLCPVSRRRTAFP
jgi:hypothetical protein